MPQRLAPLAAMAALIAACSNSTTSGSPDVILSPLVDSLFVGDSATALQVTYHDAAGNTQPAGTVTWSSGAPTVATVDAASGVIHAVGPGSAVISAVANGTTGQALVAVSRRLDLTILLDSVYLMPTDTFTIPVSVRHQATGTPTVWFTAPSNAVFAIDSASGRDSAKSPGAPLPFIAHAALGADTIVDTGYTSVVVLADTTGGVGYFTVYGSVVRQVAAGERALNYRRADRSPTFRVRSFVNQGNTTVEAVIITLLDSLSGPGVYAIDSIAPAEAFTTDPSKSPVCYPARPWGTWSALFSGFRLDAVSRPAGTLGITRVVPVVGGKAISGRYTFLGQRTDYYTNPLGAVTIRGTFVAPLISTTSACQ